MSKASPDKFSKTSRFVRDSSNPKFISLEDAMVEVDELKSKLSWNEEKLLEKLTCSNSFLKQNQ